MTIYSLNPLTDPRWPELLERHKDASVFHTREWITALARTYCYTPIVYTTCPPDSPLTNGVVFTEVNSRLTGSRLVSLSFSDHCQPLVNSMNDLEEILDSLIESKSRQGWKYIQIRPFSINGSRLEALPSCHVSEKYYCHQLDLIPEEDVLLKSFHKDCIKRPIRRAERERLVYREENSETTLDAFYRMLLMTRRKHQLPPQPKKWFHTLMHSLGNKMKIRIAYKEKQPVAGIVTLSFKHTHYYKYGCSDPKYKKYGGSVALLWRAMREARADGATVFDLGRSGIEHTSLTQFKDRWGTQRIPLWYYSAGDTLSLDQNGSWKVKLVKSLFSHLPDPVLKFMGTVLYKHMG